jgi:hypothetical protein
MNYFKIVETLGSIILIVLVLFKLFETLAIEFYYLQKTYYTAFNTYIEPHSASTSCLTLLLLLKQKLS